MPLRHIVPLATPTSPRRCSKRKGNGSALKITIESRGEGIPWQMAKPKRFKH